MISGEKLRLFREEQRVKAADVAREIGASRQYVSELEHAESVQPQTAEAIMRAIEVVSARRDRRKPRTVEIEAEPTIFVGGREWK